jgi:site-specific DNA-cytosine methylase
MKYLSVCSGIEAATVAWHHLGWKARAFSEIEPFPRKVLTHHYPDVPCHGDFTTLKDEPWIGEADLLVGGTPCQAFSIAGLRQSLSDDRGNLSLEFVRLANAVDDLRPAGNGCIVVWENVPGVLSVKDNAFGCFLAALVGNDTPLVPTGGKWTNAGMVIGPQRSAAWRILDAQYFRVAQRRRRVFVVASAREGFDPAEVLFEREGVRRDTAPRRETRKDVAGNSARCFDRQRSDEYGEAGIASTMSARDYKSAADLVAEGMAVRRLTPRECERLQGFPDDYTAIPGAADGPRYKALGNSMAVPVMRWIGERIDIACKAFPLQTS